MTSLLLRPCLQTWSQSNAALNPEVWLVNVPKREIVLVKHLLLVPPKYIVFYQGNKIVKLWRIGNKELVTEKKILCLYFYFLYLLNTPTILMAKGQAELIQESGLSCPGISGHFLTNV